MFNKGGSAKQIHVRLAGKHMNRRKTKTRKNRLTTAAVKILVEKHSDGYVAYPLGLRGVVLGEGDTCHGAMEDVKSAIRFHVETFGKDVLGSESRRRNI